MNPLWPLWVTASLAKHFGTVITDLTLSMEGQEKDSEKLTDVYELRIDGPFAMETTKNEWILRFEVNALINLKYDAATNIYQIQINIGKVAAAFYDIPIYKFGPANITENNGDYVGCLQLILGSGQEELIIHQYGRIDPTIPIYQASVEGHFKLEIKR